MTPAAACPLFFVFLPNEERLRPRDASSRCVSRIARVGRLKIPASPCGLARKSQACLSFICSCPAASPPKFLKRPIFGRMRGDDGSRSADCWLSTVRRLFVSSAMTAPRCRCYSRGRVVAASADFCHLHIPLSRIRGRVSCGPYWATRRIIGRRNGRRNASKSLSSVEDWGGRRRVASFCPKLVTRYEYFQIPPMRVRWVATQSTTHRASLQRPSVSSCIATSTEDCSFTTSHIGAS